MFRIGLLGAGHMGKTIIDSAVRLKIFRSDEVCVFDVNEEIVNKCKSAGYSPMSSEVELYENSEIVIIAVKPQIFELILKKLSKSNKKVEDRLVLSVAAGVSTSFIQSYLGDEKIIRIMPNTPLMIGEGACAFSRTENVRNEEYTYVKNIFQNMGVVADINEDLMSAVIPANGSSPAYVYYFMDSIVKSVEKMGLEKEMARELVAKTFRGAAEMAMQSDKELGTLVDEVCSPGGTTIETIKYFEDMKLDKIIDEGCKRCAIRAEELSL